MASLIRITTLAAIAFIGYAPAALALPSADAPEFSRNAVESITTGENDDSRKHIEKGDERAAEGRYSAARREYRKAAKIARAEGRLPVEELGRVANSYYFQGRYESSALTLEELVDEAEEYGELTVQAWALADAASVYARNAAREEATQDYLWRDWSGGKLHVAPKRPRASIDMDRVVGELERVLESPYLPDDVRQEIKETRLVDLQRLASR